MTVTTENFKVIEGVRVPIGTTLVVDTKYKGAVDMIGKRISKATYDKHFKPEPKPKAKAETQTEQED